MRSEKEGGGEKIPIPPPSLQVDAALHQPLPYDRISPLALMTNSCCLMSLPDRCRASLMMERMLAQQGTSMMTEVMLLIARVLKISVNFAI